MAGIGANSYTSDYRTPGVGSPRIGTVEKEWAANTILGAGWAFRLSPRMNIAIEHQAFGLFGTRADFIDGVNWEGNNINNRSGFVDVPNFTSLHLNFNLGSTTNRSEPLYWGGFGNDLKSSLDDMKKRQDAAFADTDNDGVIDAVDQEPNTPSDVPVDTKGRTLDSDKDGVPDFKDMEPYYPPRAGERVNEDGVVLNPIAPAGGVTEDRVKELIDEALSKYGLSEPKNNVAEWFLPMIHFGIDNYTVKYADYGTLASLARMLKSNPNIRLIVTGFTDQTGAESYNEGLSYQRAKSVIDHLVNQHGIARGRLVLHWKGQSDALVPAAASYMNRRVEFRVAEGSDVEMDPPLNLKTTGEGGY
ncbi:MAG: OmpA family protein [Saprospiraceae bacterium]